MSAVTIRIGTGQRGAPNLTGDCYDGLTQYPDLAFTAGYVFRGGTGWWQEWEALFTTYPQQSATDSALNYPQPSIEGSGFNDSVRDLGTGWSAPWETLFTTTTAPLSSYTGVAGYEPAYALGFFNSPPFTGKPKFIPHRYWSRGRFNAYPNQWCLVQPDVSKRVTLVPGPVANSSAMQFSGAEFYSTGTPGTLGNIFGVNNGFAKAFIALFRTTVSGVTPQALMSVSTAGPDDKYVLLGTLSGQTAAWLTLSAAPTVFYNPTPSVPSTFVDNGQWHIAGIGVPTSATLSPWVQTDSTVQDFALPSAMRTTAAAASTVTVGKSELSGWNFAGDVLQFSFMGASTGIAVPRSSFVGVMNYIRTEWGV